MSPAIGRHRLIGLLVSGCLLAGSAGGQTIDQMRSDQIARLQTYVLDAILPSGLVRDSLVLNPAASHFHPATPDAAGFALISLAAFDQLDTLPDADERVVDILRAYNGLKPGVNPVRSPDGHFLHFIDINTGADPPGWDDSFSPISSALVVAGAQFASNHFAMTDSPHRAEIASLAQTLTESVDFDAAIHPNLDGRVYLDMTAQGGGAGGGVVPWNEYQLVVSLAMRQPDRERATAVKHLWLNPDNAPKARRFGIDTLTDREGRFAPAFWVQQANAFNGDFRHSGAFLDYWANHQELDRGYSLVFLNEEYRYGLTAGVSPDGYSADRPFDHPGEVFSPEAVSAWGDLDTLLRFYQDQPPASDSRFRYGLTRVSDEQPGWVPFDAGLVDHLFLLFGLVESVEPDFFAERVFSPLLAGDYNGDGRVGAADYTVWRNGNGLAADGDLDGDVDLDDLALWGTNFGAGLQQPTVTYTPEPSSAAIAALLFALAPRRPLHRHA